MAIRRDKHSLTQSQGFKGLTLTDRHFCLWQNKKLFFFRLWQYKTNNSCYSTLVVSKQGKNMRNKSVQCRGFVSLFCKSKKFENLCGYDQTSVWFSP